MPFPIHDIVPCMKTSAEKTDAVMSKIQQLLHRNVTPKKYSNGQAFRYALLLLHQTLNRNLCNEIY